MKLLKLLFYFIVYILILMFIILFVISVSGVSYLITNAPVLDYVLELYVRNSLARMAIIIGVTILVQFGFKKLWNNFIKNELNKRRKSIIIIVKGQGKEIITMISKLTKSHKIALILDYLLVSFLSAFLIFIEKSLENGDLAKWANSIGINVPIVIYVIIGILITSLIPETLAILKNKELIMNEELTQNEKEVIEKIFDGIDTKKK